MRSRAIVETLSDRFGKALELGEVLGDACGEVAERALVECDLDRHDDGEGTPSSRAVSHTARG
jgi:hypothetical protein